MLLRPLRLFKPPRQILAAAAGVLLLLAGCIGGSGLRAAARRHPRRLQRKCRLEGGPAPG